MAWIPIAATAAEVLGSYLGQKSANKTNMELGQKQMDFQERMRSTQYQTAVKDMQAAGLNPMLAYSQGGAGTPSGSLPTVQNVMGGVAGSAKHAGEIMRSMQDIAQSKDQQEQLRQNTEKLKAETINAQASAANIAADTELKLSAAGKTDADASNSRASLLGVTARSAAEADAYNAAARQGDGKESAFEADARKRKAQADEAGYSSRKRKAEATNEELQTAGEKAHSDFYKSQAGRAAPYLNLGGDLISSATQIKRAFSPKKPK